MCFLLISVISKYQSYSFSEPCVGQLWAELLDEVVKADAGILIPVESEHQTLKLSLSDVEPRLGEDVSQITMHNLSLSASCAVFKCFSYVEVWSLGELDSEGFHASFSSQEAGPERLQLMSGVSVEESHEVAFPLCVVVRSVSNKCSVLSTEWQYAGAKVVKRAASLVFPVEASIEEIDVVACEVMELEILLETICQVLSFE